MLHFESPQHAILSFCHALILLPQDSMTTGLWHCFSGNSQHCKCDRTICLSHAAAKGTDHLLQLDPS